MTRGNKNPLSRAEEELPGPNFRSRRSPEKSSGRGTVFRSADPASELPESAAATGVENRRRFSEQRESHPHAPTLAHGFQGGHSRDFGSISKSAPCVNINNLNRLHQYPRVDFARNPAADMAIRDVRKGVLPAPVARDRRQKIFMRRAGAVVPATRAGSADRDQPPRAGDRFRPLQ